MGNMSYCRFRNTLPDLRACLEAIQNGEEFSAEELKAKKTLVSVCKGILEEEGFEVTI